MVEIYFFAKLVISVRGYHMLQAKVMSIEMSGATDTDHGTATTGWETASEGTKSVKASGI